MALQVIGCDVVPQLVSKLMATRKVVAPQRREGRDQWAFAEVRAPDDVCLDYVTTIIPPKKYALPAVETLLRYRLADGPELEAVIAAEPLALFGVHPCDIYGLTALDLALGGENADPNYAAHRQRMFVVGTDCEPDDHCFCGSLGTASVASGYDLFLTALDGDTLVEIATDEGAAVMRGLPSRDATAAELAAVKEKLIAKVQKTQKLHTEYHQLPLLLSGLADSKVWAEQAEPCYSCGTCNLVCPTCYCFDVVEQMDLSLTEGRRERHWDGCMLEGFARVATGENFREEREDRLRHRFYRKYDYLFTRYGRPYCCGCGRCARQCLVHIDPVEVLNDLSAQRGKVG